MTIIKKSIDINNLPSISKKDLEQLDAIQDADIDFSDIPELNDGFFEQAILASEFKKDKTRITMRLDTDVLEWLKNQGKGYQTRANMILRAAMEHQNTH